MLEDTEPDTLIDVTSGSGIPDLVMVALAQGVDVISANTRSVAHNLHATIQTAKVNGANYKFGACISGGFNMLKFIQSVRAKSPITTIQLTGSGAASFILSNLSQGENLRRAKSRARIFGASYSCQHDALSYERQRTSMDLVAYAAFGTTLANLSPSIDLIETDDQARIIKSEKQYHPVITLQRSETGVGAQAVLAKEVSHPELEAGPIGQVGIVLHTQDEGVFSLRGDGLGPRFVVDTLLSDLSTIHQPMKTTD